MAPTSPFPSRPRRPRAVVLEPDDVADGHAVHPGVVVWLGEPRLAPEERSHLDEARRTAMRLHPSAQPAPLRSV